MEEKTRTTKRKYVVGKKELREKLGLKGKIVNLKPYISIPGEEVAYQIETLDAEEKDEFIEKVI